MNLFTKFPVPKFMQDYNPELKSEWTTPYYNGRVKLDPIDQARWRKEREASDEYIRSKGHSPRP